MEDVTKKKVDESWKERVEKEKVVETSRMEEAQKEKAPTKSREPQEETPQEEAELEHESHPVEANFSMFVSGLGMQALMCLGEIANPVTNKKEKNLNQARYIIDTIEMLKNKTEGKLTQEESNMMDSILYEIRMKYVAKKEE